MNILIACTDSYVKYYKVMLTSLCENNKNTEINIWLFHSGVITKENIKELKTYLKKYNVKFHESIHREILTDNWLGKAPIKAWCIEAYFRLFVFGLLPDDVKKILYLDSDIIVNKSLEEFYDQDFDGNLFVACEETGLSRNEINEIYSAMNITADSHYFNAGVLLINLEDMRKQYRVQEVIDFIRKNGKYLRYPDQDVLNVMFHTKIKMADSYRFNCIIGNKMYTEKKKILAEAVVLHFASLRPWSVDYGKKSGGVLLGGLYWKYARKSYGTLEYLKWKVLNTVKVFPWRFAWRFYKLLVRR